MGANATQPIANRPIGKLSLSANQENLVSGVNTLVELNSIMPNFIDGIEDVVNHRIRPNRVGFYLVIGQVTFSSVIADKPYELRIVHREDVGFSIPYAEDIRHSRTTDNLVCQVADLIWLAEDEPIDAFELWVTQTSGVNTVDIEAGSPYTFLSVQRIR